MLIARRYVGQSIILHTTEGDIVVEVAGIQGKRAELKIGAPQTIRITINTQETDNADS